MKRTVLTVAATALVAAALAFGLGRASSETGGRAVSANDEGTAHEADAAASEPPAIADAEHIHAVTYIRDGLLLGAHSGLYRSGDGGRTWERVDAGGELEATDFMSLVAHPTEPDTLFAGGHGLGVVKSADGGATWIRSDVGIDGSDIHALAINQRQPEYLFAYSTGKGVYRSSDGGSSWDRLDDGPENPGVRSFTYMAVRTEMDESMGSDNWGLLFAGTTDGVYDSYSCFCGWRQTTDQFDGATVYALATVQADLRTMYAGTTDGLWRSTDEGEAWERFEGIAGRIAAVAIDPVNPDGVTAVSELGVVFASTDAGRSWDQMN